MRRYIGLFLFLSVVYAKNEIYQGASLYDVTVKDLDQAQYVNELEHTLFVDVWSHALPSKPGQILVTRDTKNAFQNALDEAGIEYQVAVENIKELIDLEEAQMANANRTIHNRATNGLPFDRIYTYSEVNDYLEVLANAYPNLVTLHTAGQSFQGRDINYIKISTTNFQDTSKPVVMLQSLIHAREWISLPATLYAIHKLVIDVTDSDLVENIDWIIMPIVNPDGYIFSHTNTRFWRKNRATGYMIGNVCMGVDLNRNFGVFWGVAAGASVCGEDFRGRAAFSEPETQAVRDVVLEHADRMEFYLDVHAFGSMVLWSYGNGDLPSNALILNMLGVRMASAIDAVKLANYPDYIIGNIALTIYSATGGANDYATLVGVPFAYCYELPARRGSSIGTSGFLVDDSFIEQAGYETWEGIKVGVRYAADNYRRKIAVTAAIAA